MTTPERKKVYWKAEQVKGVENVMWPQVSSWVERDSVRRMYTVPWLPTRNLPDSLGVQLPRRMGRTLLQSRYVSF